MTAFPGLDEAARRRLAARGIDPDRSLAGFLAEVRVKPPPRLLRDLGVAPVVMERQITHDSLPSGGRGARRRRAA